MSFELLFDDIVRERGLSSAPDLAIARAAARLLAADDGSPVEAAAAVAKLLAMLPPKTASPVMNLSLLTDEEVSLFERLIKKIHGQPVEPIPTIQVEFVNPAPADDSAEEARRLRDDLQVARGRIEALEQMLGSGPQKPAVKLDASTSAAIKPAPCEAGRQSRAAGRPPRRNSGRA